MKLLPSFFVVTLLAVAMTSCASDSTPHVRRGARPDASTQRVPNPTPPRAAMSSGDTTSGSGTAPDRGVAMVDRPATADRWTPSPGAPWQLQLTGRIDTSVDAAIFDIDGFDTPASTVAELHERGRRVVCYFSAGTFENWRPDANSFPDVVLGSNLDEWPGERWLDIRRVDLLEPIMARRMDMCVEKGFDAVDPDNVDGYANRSGFPLTADDQLRYNRMLARLAHERGLSIGLKNDLDQVADLVDDYDFAVNEQCMEYNECSMLDPFVKAGKAVLHVEYNVDVQRLCNSGPRPGFSSIRKNLDLGPRRESC